MNAQARSFDIRLDRRGGTPLYVQLKHHIVFLIGSGELGPGTALPSVRQVAAELDMAPATVQRTYADLQSQGMLVGQSGRGIFVADLAAIPEGEASNLASMRQLLRRVVTQVSGAGLTEDEIIGTVRDVVGKTFVRPAPRLVFVAASEAFADVYRDYLRDALADTKCDVETVLLTDLEKRGDEALDELEPIAALVSVVGTFTELRRLASHRVTTLFPLVVDLTEETQWEFINLPADASVGLVAERHLLATRSALLKHFRGTEDEVPTAAITDRAAVRALLKRCSVVVHSAGAAQLLRSLARPGTRLIEMRYRPNAASIAKLRTLLLHEGR
jgi:GntR family transcriptional regulator